MKKLLSLLPIVASLSFANEPANECSKIEKDNQRLACYDAIFRPIAPPSIPKPTLPEKPSLAKEKQDTQKSNELFGLEHKVVEQSPDQISSKAIGHFSHWKKNMEIQLENGQVWKINDAHSLYYKVDNPEVKLEKGIFGSFFMRIEGINRRLKVSRIK